MNVLVRFRILLGLCLVLLRALIGPVQADATWSVSPTVTVPRWEGWGTAVCWWGHIWGFRTDFANVLFTTNTVTLNGAQLPGLGLNIARYNAGASLTNFIQKDHMQVSPNISAARQMPGYWLNWYSTNPASASWDWNQDRNQRSALLLAKERGANLFELFSNSPMWWMCYNHNPSGADQGGNDNLQSWNYRQHAVYLATIARHARDAWGISFDSVEPFNEPSAGWWSAQGTQEGCHFDRSTQETVIENLRSELDWLGLNDVQVSASDENSYSDALTTWNALSPAVRAEVGRINVHGYEYSNGPRSALAAAVTGKRLWTSEYGEGDASGLSLAQNLSLDLADLRPSAWCYWQPFDYGGWGLIQADGSTGWVGPVNPKYYVAAHFTRHIRPGMQILQNPNPTTVAAFAPGLRRLVLVTVNAGAAQTVTFDLHGLASAGGPCRRWLTAPAAGDLYTRLSNPQIVSQSLSTRVPAASIQTVEIDNVDLIPPPPPLSIRPSTDDASVILEWPSTAATYALQTSPTLRPPTRWKPTDIPPQPVPGGWRATVRIGKDSTVYYRLQGN